MICAFLLATCFIPKIQEQSAPLCVLDKPYVESYADCPYGMVGKDGEVPKSKISLELQDYDWLPVSSGQDSVPGNAAHLTVRFTNLFYPDPACQEKDPGNSLRIFVQIASTNWKGNASNAGSTLCPDMSFAAPGTDSPDWVPADIDDDGQIDGYDPECNIFFILMSKESYPSGGAEIVLDLKVNNYDGASSASVVAFTKDYEGPTLTFPVSTDQGWLPDVYELGRTVYDPQQNKLVPMDPCFALEESWDSEPDLHYYELLTGASQGSKAGWRHDELGDGVSEWGWYRGFVVDGKWRRDLQGLGGATNPYSMEVKKLFIVNRLSEDYSISPTEILDEHGVQPVFVKKEEQDPKYAGGFLCPPTILGGPEFLATLDTLDPQDLWLNEVAATLNYNNGPGTPDPTFQASVMFRPPGDPSDEPLAALVADSDGVTISCGFSKYPSVNDYKDEEGKRIGLPIFINEPHVYWLLDIFGRFVPSLDGSAYKDRVVVHEMVHKLSSMDHPTLSLSYRGEIQNLKNFFDESIQAGFDKEGFWELKDPQAKALFAPNFGWLALIYGPSIVGKLQDPAYRLYVYWSVGETIEKVGLPLHLQPGPGDPFLMPTVALMPTAAITGLLLRPFEEIAASPFSQAGLSDLGEVLPVWFLPHFYYGVDDNRVIGMLCVLSKLAPGQVAVSKNISTASHELSGFPGKLPEAQASVLKLKAVENDPEAYRQVDLKRWGGCVK